MSGTGAVNEGRGDAERADGPVTRRRLLGAGAASVIAGGLLAGCGSGSSTTTAAAVTTASGSGKKRKVIWALAGIAQWNLTYDVGFHDACEVLGWEYQKVGLPVSQYNPENVVKVIRQATVARPDVLVTPAWVPGVAEAAAEAQKKGIYVMFNNTNNIPKDSIRLGIPFVGTNDRGQGQQLARAMLPEFERRGVKGGTIIFANPFPGQGSLEDEATGFHDVMDPWNTQKGTTFKLEHFDDKSLQNAQQSVSLYQAKFSQLGKAFVGLVNSGSFTIQIKALQQRGFKPGEILVGAFDPQNPIVTDGIRNGWVFANMDRQGFAQGFLPPVLASMALDFGFQPSDYLSNGEVVTKANLAAAEKRDNKIVADAKRLGVKLS